MTNLKDVNFGINQFCGPAVLSAFTGKTTDECAAVISIITGKMEIRGVNTHHLIKALEKLRFKVEKQRVYGYTLYAVLNYLINKDGLYLITVPRHFIAIEVKDKQVYIVDNHTKEPINAAGSSRLTQNVVEIMLVTPLPQPVFIRSLIQVASFLGRIEITKMNIYENKDDCVDERIGWIYYKTDEELIEMIRQLRSIAGMEPEE